MSTKLGVTENFVSSLYLLIQSSTLKKCIEHCLTALATLLHVDIYMFVYMLLCYVYMLLCLYALVINLNCQLPEDRQPA